MLCCAGVLGPCCVVCCLAGLFVWLLAVVFWRLLLCSCWCDALLWCSVLFGAVLRQVAVHCVWCFSGPGWRVCVLLPAMVLCRVLGCGLCSLAPVGGVVFSSVLCATVVRRAV